MEPRPKMTNRQRVDRAITDAENLALDLRVLGYKPQAALVQEVANGLYLAKLNRAVADLSRR